MTEQEWEKREREEKRRARRGLMLDLITVGLMLAIVVCLLILVWRR